MNFNVSTALDNTTGITKFGFSGDTSLEFSLSSGQLFVSKPQNLFLSSYSSNQVLNVSGNVDADSYDVWINNTPYAIGLNKPTGAFRNFYVDSSNVTTDLSLKMWGDAPNYSYDPFESYFSGQIIPLNITNSGTYPFKIFSGEIVNNNNFVLDGVNNIDVTGSKILNLISTNFSPTQQEIPITLYTNFGNIDLTFTASGIPIDSGNFYLFFGPDNPSIVTDIPNNYIVTVKSFTGAYLYTKLEYVSGLTGRVYRDVQHTALATGDASGVIVGSGKISSLETGLISAINPINGLTEYGTGTGYVEKYIVASGDVSGEYSATLTGLASGMLNMYLPATGYTTVTYSGPASPVGNFVTYTGLTGFGTGYSDLYGFYQGIIESGIGQLYVKYTGQVTGINNVQLDPSQYQNISFVSPTNYATGFYSRDYVFQGLAYATGQKLSGVYFGDLGFAFEPGLYTFTKAYSTIATGYSDIFTGFNPVTVTSKLQLTTGFIFVQGFTGQLLDSCDISELFFESVGLPYKIFDASGRLTKPVHIGLSLAPDSGEYPFENSDYLNTGVDPIRTDISRHTNTPSGTGWFDNVFQVPFFTGDKNYATNRHGWQEWPTGYYTSGKNNYPLPSVRKFLANSYLVSGQDSGVCEFYITGSFTGKKTYLFKSTPGYDNYYPLLSLYSATGQLLAQASGIGDQANDVSILNQYADNSYINSAYIYTGLLTGKYKLVTELVKKSEYQLGWVGFTAPVFSGCENWDELYFSVSRSGESNTPFAGQVKIYPDVYSKPNVSGTDYITNSGIYTVYPFFIPAGVNDVSFRLPLWNDGNLEVTERIQADLLLYSPYEDRIYRNTARIDILDDELKSGSFCNNPVVPPSGIIIDPPTDPNPPSPPPVPGPPTPPQPPIDGPGGGGGGGGGGEIPRRDPPVDDRKCCDPEISLTLNLGPYSTETDSDKYEVVPCIAAGSQNIDIYAEVFLFGNSDCYTMSPQPIWWGNVCMGNCQGLLVGLGSFPTLTFSKVLSPGGSYTASANGSARYVKCNGREGEVGLSDGPKTVTVPEPGCVLKECWQFPPDERFFCDCEREGKQSNDTCPMGFHAEPVSVTPSDCECSNRGTSMSCYECIEDREGCSCGDFGYAELGSCAGCIPQCELNVVTIPINDDTCENVGTTIQCSVCGCCNAAEDGCQCGGEECCCGLFEAPDCSTGGCVYVGGNC